MALKVGDKAPAFNLKNQDGETISLSNLKGKPIVLYFYPKDDTSGCTKEACSFSDDLPKFSKIDAVVLGVSPHSVKSHKKFSEKYKLKFDLLADDEKKVVEKYGVWKEKSMYGRKYIRLAGLSNQDWAPSLSAGLGTFILTLVVNGIGLIPCIGWVVPALVGMVGLGAALVTRYGARALPDVEVVPSSTQNTQVAQTTPLPSAPPESPSPDLPAVDTQPPGDEN